MNTWEFLREMNRICRFQTREGRQYGYASNSELKRWCQNGAVIINGEKAKFDQKIIFPINSFVLFKKHSVTLF